MKAEQYTLYDIAEHVQKAGLLWADAKQLLDHKERFSKVLLSQLIVGYKNSRGKTSQAELERLAYADPDYERYLTEWQEAQKKELELRIKLEAWKNLFTACQDKQATLRREKPIL